MNQMVTETISDQLVCVKNKNSNKNSSKFLINSHESSKLVLCHSGHVLDITRQMPGASSGQNPWCQLISHKNDASLPHIISLSIMSPVLLARIQSGMGRPPASRHELILKHSVYLYLTHERTR